MIPMRQTLRHALIATVLTALVVLTIFGLHLERSGIRTVIIPQAVRRVVPPLLNDFIGLQKDTALIGVMGVIDAFTQSRLVGSAVFNLSPVTVVAIIFVMVTIPQSRFVDRMIEKDQARQQSGSN